ncbi:MAG: hypothetical protein GEU87_02520 [Alphaproteobacteria bacterium]|nr:hypothetical protein [Alphaproteobacteria bacterium]
MSILSDYSLTAGDVARICGVTPDTPAKWRRDGIGPAPVRRGGRKWLYREDETLEFAAKRMAFEQARAALQSPAKVTVKTNAPLRQRLSYGIVTATVEGRVTFQDARVLAKSLGYPSLHALDAHGVAAVISGLDRLGRQRAQERKPKPQSNPKRKARVSAKAGSAAQ